MLSDCYSDLVPETGERLCCYDDVEDAAPRLPLATASFDEAADRLVVGDAAGVVWEINGGAKGALETHHQLSDAPLTRLEAVFRLPGSVNEPARPGRHGRPAVGRGALCKRDEKWRRPAGRRGAARRLRRVPEGRFLAEQQEHVFGRRIC